MLNSCIEIIGCGANIPIRGEDSILPHGFDNNRLAVVEEKSPDFNDLPPDKLTRCSSSFPIEMVTLLSIERV